MSRGRRGDTVGITVLRVRRTIAGCRLQYRWLLVVRIMRHGAGSGALRGVWLSGGHMGMVGMDIHVRRSLIHAAERGRAGIVAVLWNAIFGIQRQPALRSQIRGWRGAPGLVNRRSTGQTGTGAGRGARAGILIESTRRGLGCGRQAQRGELVARQQRSFGGVGVVPGDISRTAGVDLRDRRQLQLFGFTEHWGRREDGGGGLRLGRTRVRSPASPLE